MQLETEAIVCGLRAHGEHGAIVRMLTPDHGLVAAYLRGARGRRMRPVLIPGNIVAAQLRWRNDAQLPQASVELARSRAPILAEALPAAAIEWVTALAVAVLPERQPYPRVHSALDGLLDAIEAAPSAKGWGAALARYELLLLAQLGYESDYEPAGPPGDKAGEWPAILESLDFTGEQLFREALGGRARSLHDCRARLVDRLRRLAA